jgi:hypothetical protein
MTQSEGTSMERRKVTMISFFADPVTGMAIKHEAIDFVGVDDVDAYVADARTRWQSVIVGTSNEHGPGGDKGHYALPQHIKRGITLDQHLDEQGIPNRTDHRGFVLDPKASN